MTQEQEYWRRLLKSLQGAGMTAADIARAVGVEDRQFWNWKLGDRPKGLTAVRLYRLHVERCGALPEPELCDRLAQAGG